jgi:hypothetical protein
VTDPAFLPWLACFPIFLVTHSAVKEKAPEPEPLEANGDQEAAANALCKKGLAMANKKATCVAAEGRIAFVSARNKAVMVKLNCETDFVRNDSSFLDYCGKVANAAVNVDDNNVKALTNGETLESTRQALVSKIGENIQVRQLASRVEESKFWNLASPLLLLRRWQRAVFTSTWSRLMIGNCKCKYSNMHGLK